MWTIVKYTETGGLYEVVNGTIYKNYDDAQIAYGEYMAIYTEAKIEMGLGSWLTISKIDVPTFS